MKTYKFIKCILCGDILDPAIEGYMVMCSCKAIGYDWMRGGKGRHRIIGNKEDLIYL